MSEAAGRALRLLGRRAMPRRLLGELVTMRPALFADPAAAAVRRGGGTRLSRFAGVSIGAHVAAALLVLLWRLPMPRQAEVPATIEVLFGDNADRAGSPGVSSSAEPARPPPMPAAAPIAAPAADGTETEATAPAPALAAHPAAAMAVRLGEGDVGLKLSGPPDAGMIEAQVDPGNRAPKFPDIAVRQHQYGRVVVRLHIDTAGRVIDVEMLESSGHPALDRAAREALALWHFIPALQDGAAVPSVRDQAVNFVAGAG